MFFKFIVFFCAMTLFQGNVSAELIDEDCADVADSLAQLIWVCLNELVHDRVNPWEARNLAITKWFGRFDKTITLLMEPESRAAQMTQIHHPIDRVRMRNVYEGRCGMLRARDEKKLFNDIDKEYVTQDFDEPIEFLLKNHFEVARQDIFCFYKEIVLTSPFCIHRMEQIPALADSDSSFAEIEIRGNIKEILADPMSRDVDECIICLKKFSNEHCSDLLIDRDYSGLDGHEPRVHGDYPSDTSPSFDSTVDSDSGDEATDSEVSSSPESPVSLAGAVSVNHSEAGAVVCGSAEEGLLPRSASTSSFVSSTVTSGAVVLPGFSASPQCRIFKPLTVRAQSNQAAAGAGAPARDDEQPSSLKRSKIVHSALVTDSCMPELPVFQAILVVGGGSVNHSEAGAGVCGSAEKGLLPPASAIFFARSTGTFGAAGLRNYAPGQVSCTAGEYLAPDYKASCADWKTAQARRRSKLL